MWARIKALCLHSTTIAWSYVLAAVGGILQVSDAGADVFNDQGFKDTIHTLIGDPLTFGRILLGISIINIIARLRTLRKAAP